MAEQYAPYDENNLWKLDTFMNNEEWKQVTKWYDYSLRYLAVFIERQSVSDHDSLSRSTWS